MSAMEGITHIQPQQQLNMALDEIITQNKASNKAAQTQNQSQNQKQNKKKNNRGIKSNKKLTEPNQTNGKSPNSSNSNANNNNKNNNNKQKKVQINKPAFKNHNQKIAIQSGAKSQVVPKSIKPEQISISITNTVALRRNQNVIKKVINTRELAPRKKEIIVRRNANPSVRRPQLDLIPARHIAPLPVSRRSVVAPVTSNIRSFTPPTSINERFTQLASRSRDEEPRGGRREEAAKPLTLSERFAQIERNGSSRGGRDVY
eukprot:TRINITY_DN1654_c0_g1_i1.p1 TRINITY_DN1654_c0_g1~~TRINITY_DN1654_c0_g1_i1.p1  ORF type:complete len:275 (+),score=103.30 TRINITY_DN1654_c0_g1_i1:46-825(+)